MKEESVAVPTSYGDILVQIYGERSKHPMVTFHDIGLNAEDNFRNFFQHTTAPEFTNEFCIYNINAPGQESQAAKLPIGYHYPSMESLANLVDEIVRHFDFKCFVGFGVGAGSYVLLQYALKHSNRLDALILVNSIAKAPSWIEWGREKLEVHEIKKSGMTPNVVEFLLWHSLGSHIEKCSPGLVEEYRKYFETLPNPMNLAAFLESYLNRKTITFPHEIEKDILLLQIVGEKIYSLTDVEHIRHKLEPNKSELLKLANCSGKVFDERPDKVTEAIMLFLQGVGFFPSINVHDVVKRITDG